MLVSMPRDCCLESSEEFSAVVRGCAESLVEFELDSTAAISLRAQFISCLLYTSDAADEEDSVDLGGRRDITKKKK